MSGSPGALVMSCGVVWGALGVPGGRFGRALAVRGRLLGRPRAPKEVSLVTLGALWGPLGSLRASLGFSWAHSGVPWTFPGSSSVPLDSSWAPLGFSWMALECFVSLLGRLRTSRGRFVASL